MEALFICYPKCSTCAKARKFCRKRASRFRKEILRRKIPRKRSWLSGFAKAGSRRKFFNTSGMLYREKNLKAVLPGLTQQEKIRLLAEDGMLVKRPLLIGEGFVLAGFRQGQWEEALAK